MQDKESRGPTMKPAPTVDLELLTPKELQAKLKISSRTYRRMVAAGSLPHRLLGASRRFLWTEVLAALPRGSQVSAQGGDWGPKPLDLAAILKDRAKHWRGR